jgi:hypothetical protein
LVIGGTSLAADNVAENTIGPVVDGPVGLLLLLLPQRTAVTPTARAIAPIINRFMRILLPGVSQNFLVMLNPR